MRGETAASLPPGLTDADAARIASAIAAARSETPRTVYAQIWDQWERCALPAASPPYPAIRWPSVPT